MEIKGSACVAVTLALALMLPSGASADASQIQSHLRTLLGPVGSAIDVTGAGKEYLVTIDAELPLGSWIDTLGHTLAITPYNIKLEEVSTGRWSFEGEPQEFRMTSASQYGNMEFRFSIYDLKFSGNFDEATMLFSDVRLEFSSMTRKTVIRYDQGLNSANDPGVKVVISESTMGFDGWIDTELNGNALDLIGQAKFGQVHKSISEERPINLEITSLTRTTESSLGVEALKIDFSLAGVVWDAIRELMNDAAGLAIYPGLEGADGAKFIQNAQRAIPFFDQISVRAELENAKISVAQVGEYHVDGLELSVDSRGATADGMVVASLGVAGLSLPKKILADWQAAIAPRSGKVTFSFSDFNADKFANMWLLYALDSWTMRQARQTWMEASFPKGAFKLSVHPAWISGEGYDLMLDGDIYVDAKTGEPAEGQATARMTGLDNVLNALRSAPPEMSDLLMALMMARGFSKWEADGGLVWNLKLSEDGDLSVNGASVGSPRKW
ncbi:hypothetical protein [Sedimentimonas flavescens]|uniref:hypothetical protein n=1 Tax=Sedimentimonas flavescens TaxID=2851012 RepID=UPI001C4A6062|nr:hypothetical protein [Sedimentimonas flavescens]MBW0158399.1 hypothetical protein [Sedimentimonas flavescens]